MIAGGEPHLWVIGAGRLGLALGSELLRARWAGRITFTSRHSSPPDHPVFADAAVRYVAGVTALPEPPTCTLIAVPDVAIAPVAAILASLPATDGTVIHVSGVLGSDVLDPVRRSGVSTASLHPLVSIADPVRDAELLRGAWFGVEGEGPAARAANEIVEALGGRSIPIEVDGKALYHAAAVFASNYVVALLSVAERLFEQAGVPAATGRPALTDLAAGAVRNVAASDPGRALTGPLARGDTAAIERHLSRLSAEDRQLYSVLAREALTLANSRGLAPAAAARLTDLLMPGIS